ncbi:nitrile hydratase accessory protein [Pseudooceanicola aestuarii]|uniref:nitrile hydratase accessory protein n=1 Tax=Pseudooceanicola aestuarii TaxID=2697319 RepID=UPI001EF7727E|nr:nitrile hydratase accessory protein [Pseudooceanicola aestuarii]
MTASDHPIDTPGLPRDAGGEPVFFEPWQARAFAVTVALHQAGTFSWTDWAATLSAQLSRHPAKGACPEDHARAYFHAWLAATEELLTARAVTDPARISEAAATWQRAAAATPHGRPIEYAAGLPAG